MKKHLLFALMISVSCSLFTACSDDDDEEEETIPTYTVSFEDVELNSDGYNEKSSYTYNDELTFVNGYTEYEYDGYTYSYFTGFVFSSLTDMTTIGYTNQYSVYNANGGNNGSSQFGICYSYGEITASEAITPQSAYFCLTTYTYLAVHDGTDGYVGEAGQFADGDYLSVTLTGSLNNETTGSVTFYPADYRDGAQTLYTSWTKVDLTALGTVDDIIVTFDGTIANDYGLLTPTYIAVDDFTYTK